MSADDLKPLSDDRLEEIRANHAVANAHTEVWVGTEDAHAAVLAFEDREDLLWEVDRLRRGPTCEELLVRAVERMTLEERARFVNSAPSLPAGPPPTITVGNEVVDYVTGMTAAQANDPDTLRRLFCETSKELAEERRKTARLKVWHATLLGALQGVVDGLDGLDAAAGAVRFIRKLIAEANQ